MTMRATECDHCGSPFIFSADTPSEERKRWGAEHRNSGVCDRRYAYGGRPGINPDESYWETVT